MPHSLQRRHWGLTVLLILSVIFVPKAQQLTPAQWREDLTYLYDAMLEIHPNPFHRVAQREFERYRDSLAARIPSLPDREIVAGLMGLTALLHDGHSGLLPFGPSFPPEQFFPVRFSRMAEGIFITGVGEKLQPLLGAKVLRIGRITAEEAWVKIAKLAGADNAANRMTWASLLLTVPGLHEALGIGSAEKLVLAMQTVDGQEMEASLSPVTDAMAMHRLWGSNQPPGGGLTLPNRELTATDWPYLRQDKPYWYALDPTDSLLYAQINQIQNASAPVWLNGKEQVVSLAEFGEAIMAQIDAGRVGRLVLDLRNNGGGNNGLIRSFVEELATRPIINQRGRLFVITGHRTYSAAMNFVSLLESRTRALFVGEAPGGSPYHYGDATGLTLPNSGLRVRISTLTWNVGVSPWDVRELMEPDIPIVPHIDYLRIGRDVALLAIKSYLEGDVLSDKLWRRYQQVGMDSLLAGYPSELAGILPPPWHSDLQQWIDFAFRLDDKTAKEDIDKLVAFLQMKYPTDPYLWFTLGRFHGWYEQWERAEAAFARAHELRPQNDLIRRMYALSKRRTVGGRR